MHPTTHREAQLYQKPYLTASRVQQPMLDAQKLNGLLKKTVLLILSLLKIGGQEVLILWLFWVKKQLKFSMRETSDFHIFTAAPAVADNLWSRRRNIPKITTGYGRPALQLTGRSFCLLVFGQTQLWTRITILYRRQRLSSQWTKLKTRSGAKKNITNMTNLLNLTTTPLSAKRLKMIFLPKLMRRFWLKYTAVPHGTEKGFGTSEDRACCAIMSAYLSVLFGTHRYSISRSRFSFQHIIADG